MKIKFNENEGYEIKIPEEIEAEDFFNFIEKFNNLGRLIKLNYRESEFQNFKKQFNKRVVKNIGIRKNKYSKSNPNPFTDTREKVLDILQYAYIGNYEDKKRISKVMGEEWKKIVKNLYQLRKKYNIKPQEVGLKEFKKKNGGGVMENFRIPNYIIRSYTGIFDEKEE